MRDVVYRNNRYHGRAVTLAVATHEDNVSRPECVCVSFDVLMNFARACGESAASSTSSRARRKAWPLPRVASISDVIARTTKWDLRLAYCVVISESIPRESRMSVEVFRLECRIVTRKISRFSIRELLVEDRQSRYWGIIIGYYSTEDTN